MAAPLVQLLYAVTPNRIMLLQSLCLSISFFWLFDHQTRLLINVSYHSPRDFDAASIELRMYCARVWVFV